MAGETLLTLAPSGATVRCPLSYEEVLARCNIAAANRAPWVELPLDRTQNGSGEPSPNLVGLGWIASVRTKP